MKRILKSLTVATMLAMVFAGCHREHTGFINDGGSSSVSELGYIAFGGQIVVEWDGENINTPTEGDRPDATRAALPDTDSFEVTINRVAPDVENGVESGTYAELKAKPYIELLRTKDGEECKYQIVVTSGGQFKDAAYDDEPGQPTYRGELENPFSIESDYTTAERPKDMSAYEIKCSLESIKVSVSMEKSMAELSSNVSFTVSNSPSRQLAFNDGQHHFGVANLRAEDHSFSSFVSEPTCGYLKPVNADGDVLTLTLALDYDDQHISQEIEVATDAKANQYRRILLYIEEHSGGNDPEDPDEGHIVIHVTVETWTYGEEVVVDVKSQTIFKREQVLPNPDEDNPNAPNVESNRFKIDGTTTLGASDYDENGAYTGDATVSIAAKNGAAIEHFTVQLGTDNDQFKNAYAGVFDTAIDLADSAVDLSRALLWGLGFPQSAAIAGKSELSFDLTNFLNTIYTYSGIHTIVIEVSDSEGNTSKVQLTVTFDENGGGNGPSIVWPEHDFETRYTIYDGMKVDIHIEAPAGIKSLMVHMEGNIANALGSLMPADFDLVEPNKYQDDLSGALRELKFPVEGEVEGKTSLLFDISSFMPMLQGTTENESDFQLTVIDNNDESATATIRLNVVK